jgi:hypothetical protein
MPSRRRQVLNIRHRSGFGIGFLADMKLMKGMHKKGDQRAPETSAREEAEPVAGMRADEGKPQYRVEDLGKV